MMVALDTLEVPSHKDWRRWLKENHARSRGVWLVFYKDHTGVKLLEYEESICEALCFGWVDSLVRWLDDDRYARKFTPRTATSKWSDSNRRRWAELKAAGLLAEPGLAAAPTNARYTAKAEIPELPGYIANAFRKNAKAWRLFCGLAPGYRRLFVMWIHTAKRPETREKRIRESIKLLEAGKKLGLK
jgi:uncharacterized protein YdeI (YjbR/CyaY-like superfamily)